MQRQNKYKKDKFGRIVGEVDKEDKVKTSNIFDVLEQEEVKGQHTTRKAQIQESTKYWENMSFVKSSIEPAAEKQLNKDCTEDQNQMDMVSKERKIHGDEASKHNKAQQKE